MTAALLIQICDLFLFADVQGEADKVEVYLYSDFQQQSNLKSFT